MQAVPHTIESAPAPRTPATRADRLIFGAFLGLLLWAPVPLGSNRPWSVAVLALAVWLLLIACCTATLAGGPASLRLLRPAAAPIAALAGTCALVLLQLVPLPWPSGAGRALALDPAQTRPYLLNACVYAGCFVLTLLLVRGQRRRALAVAGAFVASGVAQSLLAVALLSARARYDYLGMPFAHELRATGTLASPDHLANYLALCLCAGVGVMLAQPGAGDAPVRHSRDRLVRWLEFLMSPRMLLRLLLAVMVIALVLTRSRMGNLAFFGALLLAGLATAAFSPRLRRPASWLVASMLVVDLVILGQWIGLDRVVERLHDTALRAPPGDAAGDDSAREETLEERLRPARYALAMVAERPWLGFGGGNFHTAFPRFKGADLPGFYDHAHNDYVEIAADIGLPGLALLAAFVLLTTLRLGRLLAARGPRHHRGLAVGIGMALLVTLLHSSVDFGLQVTANALGFTTLMALAWSLPPRRSGASPRAG